VLRRLAERLLPRLGRWCTGSAIIQRRRRVLIIHKQRRGFVQCWLPVTGWCRGPHTSPNVSFDRPVHSASTELNSTPVLSVRPTTGPPLPPAVVPACVRAAAADLVQFYSFQSSWRTSIVDTLVYLNSRGQRTVVQYSSRTTNMP